MSKYDGWGKWIALEIGCFLLPFILALVGIAIFTTAIVMRKV